MGKDYSKNHIVPKRYLDRFADKGRSQYMIGTRIIEQGKVRFFMQATENVGYEKDIYDIDYLEDPKYWEHFFAKTQDALCGKELDRIIAAATLSAPDARILGDHEKDILARIMISQLLRVPSSLNHTKSIYPAISAEVKSMVRAALPLKDRRKYEQTIKRAHLSDMQIKHLHFSSAFDPTNFEKYCSLLKDRLWIVAYNTLRSNMPFVTSDHPVLVEKFFSNSKGLQVNGLSSPMTCFFFPISPSVAIINYSCKGLLFLADPQIDTKDPEVDEIIAAIYQLIDGKIQSLSDIAFIMEKNSSIINQAYRFSFMPQPLYDELIKDTNHN